MAKNSYEIDYNDKKFTEVENDKNAALKESEKMYDGMINSSDKYYDKQISAAEKWGDTQATLQQEQTDFAIEQINQQKDQAHKDYIKEQSGAYVDWQKQSNDYGTNAEKMAESGLAHSGYSESSQVSMYNTYQNRVAMARETYNKAILNYDNAIKEARLQNNAKLAEIAYQTLQTTLELSLQGFQYKNTLVLDKANKKLEIDNMYYGRYQDVLAQLNTEKSLAEQIRQFNESLAEDRRQFDLNLSLKNSNGSGYSNNNGLYGGDPLKVKGGKNPDDGPEGGKKPEPSRPKLSISSIENLGYGDIDADVLAELIALGKVTTKEENGIITFKNVGGKPTKLEVTLVRNRDYDGLKKLSWMK